MVQGKVISSRLMVVPNAIALETWLPVSLDPNERCTPARVGPGERDARVNKCSNRDGTTVQSNEKTRTGWELIVRNKLRTQLQGLNKQFGKNVTSLVTTWDGIISLRNGKRPR
jgi:hypothetical protein